MKQDRWVAAPGTEVPEGARLHLLERPDGARLRLALIPADAPRGVVVVTTGWNEFIEKYFETAETLRERGFSVVLYDTRGQGLSSRAIEDPALSYIESFDTYAEDLAAVAEEARALAPGKPLLLMAHSMGGMVTLHALATGAVDPAAVAVSSPMTRVLKPGVALSGARFLASALCALGLGAKGIPGRSPHAPIFDDNPFTSDRARYEQFKALQAAEPYCVLKSPTNAWLKAAIEAGEALKPRLASVETPILVVSASGETVVDGSDHEGVAAAAPNAEYVLIDGARHEILVEADVYRDQFWAAFDRLTARALPAN